MPIRALLDAVHQKELLNEEDAVKIVQASQKNDSSIFKDYKLLYELDFDRSRYWMEYWFYFTRFCEN
jgi:hypothetical protein